MLVEYLKHRKPLAFKTLCLAACFDPDAVPVRLIWQQRRRIPFLARTKFRDFTEFEKRCLIPLRELSLLMPAMPVHASEEDVRRIHRVVVALLNRPENALHRRHTTLAATLLASKTSTSWSDLRFWHESPWLLSNTETVVARLFDEKLGATPPQWKELPHKLIMAMIHSGNYDVASALIQKGISIAESKIAKNRRTSRPWKVALHTIYHSLLSLHAALASAAKESENTEAEREHNQLSVEAARKSYEVMRELYGDRHLSTLTHRRCIGCRLLAAKDVDRAFEMITPALTRRLAYFRKRRLVVEKLRPGYGRKLTESDTNQFSLLGYDHYLLGVVALERKDFPEAEKRFRIALHCAEIINCDGKNDFDVATSSARLAEALRHQESKTGEIKEREDRAREILRKSYLRYNCAIDLPKLRKDLPAPRPHELDLLSQDVNHANASMVSDT